MNVACPNCGTSYELAPEVLERPRLQLRCRRCQEVWHPSVPAPAEADATVSAAVPQQPKPSAEPEPTESAAPETAPVHASSDIDEPPKTAAKSPVAPPRPNSGLTIGLSVLALILVLAGTASLGYAFRDQLPGLGPPLPALSQGAVAWASDTAEPRLMVGAELTNPARVPARIDGIRVRFLNDQGAWIAERVVAVPVAVLAPGETVPIELALEELPDGTASLNLSALVDRPV